MKESRFRIIFALRIYFLWKLATRFVAFFDHFRVMTRK